VPENVGDRCTRAHEYVFMFTKSEKYLYDAKAVEERAVSDNGGNPSRNRRDVWDIPTRANGSIHFAAYPVELAEICVLAGCPEGGVVLDPFAGSGTTGVAAKMHGRNSILIELNPKYAQLAKRRIAESAFSGNRRLPEKVDQKKAA